MLDDILRAQRSPLDTTGLATLMDRKSGETSRCPKVNMQIQGQSYVDVLKNTKSHDELIFNRTQDTKDGPSKGKNAVNYNDQM